MANYKIIGFEKTTGVIIISFDPNMAPLTIEVPLNEENNYITGTELDTYIQGFVPTWYLDRINKIANGISNEADIQALVEVTPPTEPISEEEIKTSEVNANLDMWQQIETEKQIAKVLVKFGLLAEDPTAFKVTQL